jgi:hypothetical protein
MVSYILGRRGALQGSRRLQVGTAMLSMIILLDVLATARVGL